MTRPAECCARKAIELSAGEMTQGMAGKRVDRQQDDVYEEDEAADSNAETAVPIEGNDSVIPEECEKQ